MNLMMVNGLHDGELDPIPDMDPHVDPDDLDFVIPDLPPETYMSAESA
jgi:hypothetical protein